jgi:hypothetical protein
MTTPATHSQHLHASVSLPPGISRRQLRTILRRLNTNITESIDSLQGEGTITARRIADQLARDFIQLRYALTGGTGTV